MHRLYWLLGKPDQQDSWQFQQSIYDACFGRSLVMFDQSTPNQSGIWNPRCSVSCLVCGLTVWCYIVCSTEGRVISNVLIIYRSLYSSDMCSCLACSSNPSYSTTAPVWVPSRAQIFSITTPVGRPYGKGPHSTTRSREETGLVYKKSRQAQIQSSTFPYTTMDFLFPIFLVRTKSISGKPKSPRNGFLWGIPKKAPNRSYYLCLFLVVVFGCKRVLKKSPKWVQHERYWKSIIERSTSNFSFLGKYYF